jgi:glycerol-3-phosphate dehydrogenase
VPEHGPILKELFHCRYFKINTVSDADTVELCGALKVAASLLVRSKFRVFLAVGCG